MKKAMTIQLTAENQKERELLAEIYDQIYAPTQRSAPKDILRVDGGSYLSVAHPILSAEGITLTKDHI